MTKSVWVFTHLIEQDSFLFLMSAEIWIIFPNTCKDHPVAGRIPLVDLQQLQDKTGLATKAYTALSEVSSCVIYEASTVFLRFIVYQEADIF